MILRDRESGPANLRPRTSPFARWLRAYETIMRPRPGKYRMTRSASAGSGLNRECPDTETLRPRRESASDGQGLRLRRNPALSGSKYY